jgi:hypothetical protein
VATLLWDRRRDDFRLGQWLKGRIYERRSDLSPDGQYFIYFAMNGQWQSESRGAWTAISRAPYLKAIAFFPKGDCWHGGGLWTGKTTYWLNDGCGHTVARDTSALKRDRGYHPPAIYGGECLSVYYHRLMRDGWTLVEQRSVDPCNRTDIFEKSIGKGWILRKIAHAEVGAPEGKGCYWDEHELLGRDGLRSTGDHRTHTIPCPDWEWADLDETRLVWATAGKLYAAQVTKVGLGKEVELFDFNVMEFTAIEAPY